MVEGVKTPSGPTFRLRATPDTSIAMRVQGIGGTGRLPANSSIYRAKASQDISAQHRPKTMPLVLRLAVDRATYRFLQEGVDPILYKVFQRD